MEMHIEPYLTIFTEIWIALWTETNESGMEGFGAATYIGVYAMFGAFALLSLVLRGMLVEHLSISVSAANIFQRFLLQVADNVNTGCCCFESYPRLRFHCMLRFWMR